MPTARLLLGTLAGIVIVYWLFHDIDWELILSTMRAGDNAYLAYGFVCMAASQISRAIRWHIIVRESFFAKFHSIYNAAQIGLLINFLLPARIGDIVRAFLLSRYTKTETPECLGTVMVDKGFDLIVMLLALAMLSVFISLQGELVIPSFSPGDQSSVTISNDVIGYGFFMISTILICLLALLIFLYLKGSSQIALPQILQPIFNHTWISQIISRVARIADGLHVLKSGRSLLQSFAWSLAIWFFSYLAFYFIIASFFGSISSITPFVTLVMVAVFISIPVVPGVVGQYHLAVITALLFFYPDHPREVLASVALITHFMTLLVVTCLGIVAMWQSHIKFHHFRQLPSPKQLEEK